jgi:hypothetical protein
MCSFKFFNQNVCTVNVHEMYYKFNPGPSPQVSSPSNPDLWRKGPNAFRTFTKDHRTWPSRMWRTNENTNGVGLHRTQPATRINYYKQVRTRWKLLWPISTENYFVVLSCPQASSVLDSTCIYDEFQNQEENFGRFCVVQYHQARAVGGNLKWSYWVQIIS